MSEKRGGGLIGALSDLGKEFEGLATTSGKVADQVQSDAKRVIEAAESAAKAIEAGKTGGRGGSGSSYDRGSGGSSGYGDRGSALQQALDHLKGSNR